MLKHKDIWRAIDLLAENHGLSASGLARRAGLDATTFNPSKRFANDGKARWPSTESLSKILECTGEEFDKIVHLIAPASAKAKQPTATGKKSSVPMVSSSQAGMKTFIDNSGSPVSSVKNVFDAPNFSGNGVFAMKITGDNMLPFYRNGDVLIVDSAVSVFTAGDRIVLRTAKGEVIAAQLKSLGNKDISFIPLNKKQPTVTLDKSRITWISKILWVSQ